MLTEKKIQAIAQKINEKASLQPTSCKELILHWYEQERGREKTPFCLSLYRFSLLIEKPWRKEAMAAMHEAFWPALEEYGAPQAELERIRGEMMGFWHFYHTVTNEIPYSFAAGEFYSKHKDEPEQERVECTIFMMSISERPTDGSALFSFVQSYWTAYNNGETEPLLTAALRADSSATLETGSMMEFCIVLLLAEAARQACLRFEKELRPVGVAEFPRELRNKLFDRYIEKRNSIIFNKLYADNTRVNAPTREESLRNLLAEDVTQYQRQKKHFEENDTESEDGLPYTQEIRKMAELLLRYECGKLNQNYDELMQRIAKNISSQKKETEPKKTAKPKTKKTAEKNAVYAVRYICPDNERMMRLHLLLQKLLEWSWIDENTQLDSVEMFFAGRNPKPAIKWIAQPAILTYFIKRLLEQEAFIERLPNARATGIVEKGFGLKADHHAERLTEEERMYVKALTELILDPRQPLPAKEDRFRTEYDVTDENLLRLTGFHKT